MFYLFKLCLCVSAVNSPRQHACSLTVTLNRSNPAGLQPTLVLGEHVAEERAL
jgi:hypothetical protein